VPPGVVDAVVMVMVDVPVPAVSELGEKDTRAPVGRPLADRPTSWATPLVTTVEMVEVADDPAVTVPEVGEALIENPLVTTGLTVKLYEAVWVAEAPVPVTVMELVPVGVVLDVATVMVAVPPAVTVVGLKVTVVPLGSPDAPRLIDWADPLVTAVVMVEVVVVVDEPRVTVPELGVVVIEKSLVGGGVVAVGLNRARPAVQYMALVNVPVKVAAVVVPSTLSPVTTDAATPELCWAWVTKPGAVTEMGSTSEWPAMNPTARSPTPVGVAAPEVADVPVADCEEAASTGLEVATPENSWAEMAMASADDVCTVTDVAERAFGEYHNAPSELWPAV
jgi:hypothetical protein